MSQVLPKPRPLPDQLDIVVEGCRQENLHCQEQLYKILYPEMIKVCFRYAGDTDGAGTIFNNAMLKIFRALHQYTEQGKLTRWVKTIVVNCSIDFIRQKNSFKEDRMTASAEVITIEPEIFNLVSAKEIQKIIFQLPKATATVFNLYVYEGFNHREIGEMLGIADGTSKWHLNEARKRLKSQFENLLTPAIKTNAAG
jgi:RNA polymerase sigma-70 factor (ECF subfamily)